MSYFPKTSPTSAGTKRWLRLRSLGLSLLMLGLTVQSLTPMAIADPPDNLANTIRIYHESIPNGMDVYAENQQGADLTVELETTGFNYKSDQQIPFEFILNPHERRKVAHITQDDPQKAWRCGYKWHWIYGRSDATVDPNTVYELPYASGFKYKIVQGFHGTFSHFGSDEYGLDFNIPEGGDVLCSRAGTVVTSIDRHSEGAPKAYYKNRVNTVRVRHDDGTFAEYCHFQYKKIYVREGDQVSVGTKLGQAGHTGYADGAHLHMIVYKASNGRNREGLPIKFRVKGSSELVTLEQGQSYTRP